MSIATPTETIAGGSMPRSPVISATMSITARGAWAMLPKRAIMPTITNGAGSTGMSGATGASRRQMPAPTSPPMTMPGPNTPPDPPVPIDSEVARILANGRTRIITSGSAMSVSRPSAACAQP